MEKKLLIAEPITKELSIFDIHYKRTIFCDNPRIQEIIEYTLKSDGKKIRPILLLLAAKGSGQINDITYDAAVTIELLHTASLLHDDVIDESKIRRGNASVNAVYDNKAAILAGDFFLSTALITSVMTKDIRIISDISLLGRNLAEGELNQLALVKELILDEDEYFRVIDKKTASLLSVCMKIGAQSVGANDIEVAKYAELGRLLGICFQIRDDIFDYFDTNIGKPTGNDIREGKVTLPLLYAIKTTSDGEQIEILDIITSTDYSDENIGRLLAFAKRKGGIEYANEKIHEHKQRAEQIIGTLENVNIEIKKAFYDVLDYVIERKY